MAFNDTKASGDVIYSADWNAFVDFTELISSNAYGHSSNADIHYPSSLLRSWFDSVYAPTGAAGADVAWSGASSFYGFSSNAINLFGASSHTHHDLYLYKENITPFTPDGDYEPATKKYVDDNAGSGGGGTTADYQAGWALVSSQSKITHNFGSTPTIVGISPSGTDTYGYSVSYDDTYIIVYLSIAGKHCVNWFAGGPSTYQYNFFAYPQNQQITKNDDDNIYFSGQNGIYIYSGNNTIIISSSTGVGGSDVAWSGASDFYGFSSNVKDDLTALFDTSSNFDSRIDTLEGYDQFNEENYITSSNAISRFADSSNYSTHKSDSDIHFPSSSLLAWLNSEYQESGTAGSDVSWSGAAGYIGHSSNTDVHVSLTEDSQWTSAYEWVNASSQRYEELLASGTKYTQAYASAQRVKDLFDHTLYIISSNLYNKSWIDSFSGNIDTRIDSLESQEPSSWSGSAEFYTVSSLVNVLNSWYDNSSQKYSNAYASAQIAIYEETFSSEGDLTDVLDDDYHPSGYVISGSEYSRAYASAQIAIYEETYSSENDLTSELNDNYHPSGYVISGSEYSQAYASAQIALYEETYSNESDLTSVLDDNYHPSGYVISGQEYSQAYASAQIAIYTETYSNESDLTSDLDDNYHPSGFVISGAEYSQAYLHSSNSDIHVKDTTHAVFASVSSQAGISGNWHLPLFGNLTDAGSASTRPGQLIRTSGNSDGTWVWVSIYGGSSYDWMLLTYLTGN